MVAVSLSGPELIYTPTLWAMSGGFAGGIYGFTSVAGLSNGNYVVAYSILHSIPELDGQQVTELYAQIFAADGTSLGSEFQVSAATPLEWEQGTSIAALPNGGFAVAWDAVDLNAGTSPSFVHVQVFDSNGTAIGANRNVATIQHSAGLATLQARPDIAASGDSFVVSWSDVSRSPDGLTYFTEFTAAEIFRNAGSLSLGGIVLGHEASTAFGIIGDPEITFIEGGRFASVWANYNAATFGWDLHGRVSLENGNPVGNEFVVPGVENISGASGDNYAVSPHYGGGFLVVWRHFIQNQYAIVGQAFDNDGHPVGNQLPIHVFAGTVTTVDMTQLADGRLLVTWHELDSSNNDQGTWGQLLNPDGTKAGNEFSIGPIISFLNFAALASDDGRFVATWVDSSTDQSTAHAQVFSVVTHLFTSVANTVDFNNLTPGNLAIISAAEPLYNALSGNDTVILPNVAKYQLTAQVAWNPTQIFFAGAGDDTITGGDGPDSIAGEDGNDTLIGSRGNDTLNGNTSADTFDYRTNGIANFAPNTIQVVDGGDSAFQPVRELQNVIKLPGSPNDYAFGVEFTGNTFATHTRITTASGSGLPSGVEFNTVGVERVQFAQPVDNTVLTAGNNAMEMWQLAFEAYGTRPVTQHLAEALAWEQNHSLTFSENVSNAAIERGWHPVSAMELGFAPSDLGTRGVLHYSFVNGHYQAIRAPGTSLDGAEDTPEANALVLTGLVNGMRTLAVVFRGTDQVADALQDYRDTTQYYQKFRPLIDSLGDYLADTANGIQQVLVSGHSLGASAVQHLLQELPNTSAYQVRGYTAGSLGAEVAFADNRIEDIIQTGDPNFILGDLSSQDAQRAISGLARVFGPVAAGVTKFLLKDVQPKQRDHDIEINSDSPDEGTSASYVDDFAKVLQFARDAASPFSASALGMALAADTIYGGPPVLIAVGAPTTPDIHVNEFFNYVLGFAPGYLNAGVSQNVRIFHDVIPTNSVGSVHVIDGGAGNNTTLVLPAHSSAHGLVPDTSQAFGPFHRLMATVFGPSGSVTFEAAQLYRIQKVVFLSQDAGFQPAPAASPKPLSSAPAAEGDPQFVVRLDGAPVVVQSPTTGQTSLNVDHNADYTDTGSNNLTVTGTDLGDIIVIGSGNVTVNDGAGNDLIFVKDANTTGTLLLNGGAGDDLIIAAAGNDTLTGGAGDDRLNGGAGGDQMSGGPGDDQFKVDNGGDIVVENPSEGTDAVLASISFTLPDNVETLELIEGAGAINGTGNGLGNALAGNSSDNILVGGAGDDIMVGGAGADSLSGGTGEDILVIDSSDTMVDGGEGIDIVNLTGDGMTFNLAFSNIENANGTAGNDQIDGSHSSITAALTLNGLGGSDTLSGGSAGDTINGGDGDDSLFGNAGADVINGGLGIDFINGGADGDTIHGDGDNDTIFAEAGDDTIFGDGGNEYAFGGSGNDNLTGGTGTDYLVGDDNVIPNTGITGNDTLTGGDDDDTLIGGYGSDTLTGDGGNNALYGDFDDVNTVSNPGSADTLTGGSGNDFMFGGGGDDILVGGNGNNTLIGGSGNDSLTGGTGSDSYYGQAGTDTFVFGDNWNTDGVWDFTDGSELLDLSAVTGLTGFGQLSITNQVSGALNYADVAFAGNHIFIVGVTAAQLTAVDFLL